MVCEYQIVKLKTPLMQAGADECTGLQVTARNQSALETSLLGPLTRSHHELPLKRRYTIIMQLYTLLTCVETT